MIYPIIDAVKVKILIITELRSYLGVYTDTHYK